MEAGVILIVEAGTGLADGHSRLAVEGPYAAELFTESPVGLVSIFGRSLLEHTIDRFVGAGVRAVAVLAESGAPLSNFNFRRIPEAMRFYVADDMWAALGSILSAFATSGMNDAFVIKVNVYVEPNLDDLLAFHSEGANSITRVSDTEGVLDFWAVNCEAAACKGPTLNTAFLDQGSQVGSYFVKEYVKRVGSPSGLRHLVKDFFLSRCNLHPMGEVLRPGIWVDEGAQVRSGARIVGPAYLGAQCVIGECALITRMSNVEGGCFVDYGTAIEDSSVLSDTYIGTWLDVRHSIVNANKSCGSQ